MPILISSIVDVKILINTIIKHFVLILLFIKTGGIKLRKEGRMRNEEREKNKHQESKERGAEIKRKERAKEK